MNDGILLLVLLNISLIGLLPLLFFKPGKYSLRWMVTVAPFFAVPLVLVLGRLDYLAPPLDLQTQLARWISLAAVLFGVLSILLLAMTVGCHRIPLALWHQNNDAPQEIVTWGLYSRIRHPFYSSFLLGFLAATLFFPHMLTIACGVYGALILSLTAAREALRLTAGKYSDEYAKYLKQTGRFIPSLAVLDQESNES